MGLFDFVKEAGNRLGLGTEKAKAEPAPPSAPDPAKAMAAANEAMARSLEAHVRAHKIPVEDLKISFHNGVATIIGTTTSQSDQEKIILLVGNVSGVRQVDERIMVVEKEPPAQFYTVVKGDTLSKIAKQFYGSAGKYPVIFEANKPMLKDPDRIYPGQVLRIPPLKS